ncbi:serine hydrolase domain-containing protein [Aeromicrobium wangtongii]|uniref:serine hydrolase domain-containing protein n=1 Tax=Aeromicrobium wangtongii TaxID=2969247 RepID=UPI002017C349|nr:serine hydrolase domain-containing protein [Aeromicrobium wangtongii]MCL3819409.1 beta-lactamase family protein [Aeromicrobium wangtongii]
MSVGESRTAVVDPQRLDRVRSLVDQDVEEGRYHGAVLLVAVHGEIVLEEAFGSTDAATGRPAQVDDVFRLMSVTKSITTAAVHVAIDSGLLSLNTRVAQMIPEFMESTPGSRKARITVAHLLSHCSGLPGDAHPVALDELGDFDKALAAVYAMDIIAEPGSTLAYSPMANHALLGELLRRVYGADRVRDVLQEQILTPLGMKDTALGLPAALADRAVPLRASSEDLGWLKASDIEVFNDLLTPEAEMPWVGGVSTAADLFRLAELYRRRGEVGGRRLLSRALVSRVTTNQTQDWPNSIFAPLAEDPVHGFELGPGCYGYGFNLSGDSVAPSMFGTLTSPATFGRHGAGGGLFWVDPVNDVTMVSLIAGIMAEPGNLFRAQRLSDLVITSVT